MTEPGGAITREGERFSSPPHELEFVAGDPPARGVARALADGLLWLRIPLPMELNHINVWLLEDAGAWLLVDTGMAEDVCREAWLELEERVLGGRPLGRIFVTHDHPDHMGLAPWLASRHGASVLMSAHAHRSAGEFLATDPAALADRIRGFLHSHGVELPAGDAPARGDPRRWFGGLPPLSASPSDGDRLAAGGGTWTVIETGGHCRGHLCLYETARRLLISGDQVLPTISPNVSVLSSSPEADPLREFLQSIERLSGCAADTLVLPSHGRPFRGLHRRLGDLARHHREQLEAIESACREPRTASELLPTMFRHVPRGFHRMLAIGEAVAHLNYLCAEGRLQRDRDPGGVIRFQAAGAPVIA
jgi:glyoxylase-like metal-dependent hydrolase (beta-lactamase superfamily II)